MKNVYKKDNKISITRIIDIFVITIVILIVIAFNKILSNFLGTTMDIFEDYSSYYFKGLIITIFLSLLSVFFGTFLGLILYLMASSDVKSLSLFAKSYIELIRGTPLITQIFLIFFGLAVFIDFKSMGFTIANFAFVSGVIGVSLNSAAYVSEIIRSGINAIDRGQFEASLSLGMNKSLYMEEVILPQALKNILPSLANEFIAIIKETSIISTIGVTDIMYNVNLVRGASYKSIEPLIIGTILYFAITFSLSRILRLLEENYDKN